MSSVESFCCLFVIFVGSLSGAEMLSFSNLLKVMLHWTAPCLLPPRDVAAENEEVSVPLVKSQKDDSENCVFEHMF